MKLNGRQQQQFQQALLSAFPSKAKLAQMVSFELDWQLDAIAGGENLTEIVFNLIQYAQSQGKIDQLFAAARCQNIGNSLLHHFVQQLPYINGEQPSPAQQYLNTTFSKLTQNGATQLLPPNDTLDRIAKITDFEPGLGMRGDAFFLFSTYATLTPASLRSYSAACLNIAQSYPASSPSRAIFNFRIPTRCCFSIAIVLQLDSASETAIRNKNPFQDAVDTLWYEIPIIFDLSQQKLVYYEEPSNFLENFRGEIVWKKLRETIQQLLDGSAD